MLGNLEVHRLAELADRLLEGAVLEGDHPAAVAADGVVMVVAGRVDPLVAGDAAGDLDPPHQAKLLELLQRPVDAGAGDPGTAAGELVVEVEGGDSALVGGERFDHRGAGAAAAVARLLQGRKRVLGPIGLGLGGRGHASMLDGRGAAAARALRAPASTNAALATPMIAVLAGSDSIS